MNTIRDKKTVKVMVSTINQMHQQPSAVVPPGHERIAMCYQLVHHLSKLF